VAVELCNKYDAQLKLLSVVPGFTLAMVEQYFPADTQEKMVADAGAALEAFARDKVPGDPKLDTLVAVGEVYEEILAAAERTSTDLIVMGSNRSGLKDYLIGPNTSQVVRHAPVSVLVVR
jgi:nucleotide-binding universal stress UspA family protein